LLKTNVSYARKDIIYLSINAQVVVITAKHAPTLLIAYNVLLATLSNQISHALIAAAYTHIMGHALNAIPTTISLIASASFVLFLTAVYAIMMDARSAIMDTA
jgi:hypothetical protein